jgi:hypothetical protein
VWVCGCGIEGMQRSTRVSKSWQPSDRTDRRFEKNRAEGLTLVDRKMPICGLFSIFHHFHLIKALLCGMCSTSCSKSFETFLGFF